MSGWETIKRTISIESTAVYQMYQMTIGNMKFDIFCEENEKVNKHKDMHQKIYEFGV